MSNQVSKDQMAALPYIIAVDFDGTLVEDKFPEIGSANLPVIELVKIAQSKGAKIILWSCRTGEILDNAVRYCAEEHNLTFDAINENLLVTQQLFGGSSRKVYANEYWDDKAVMFEYEPEEKSCSPEACPPGCTCKNGPSYLCQP